MASVTLNNICKNYGSVAVIKDVNISIEDGEFVVFVGPSGCGKSTLLRMIAGLEDISSGTLEIDGVVVNDLPPKERAIAMVFQSYAIFPHMTVRENVAFGLTIQGMSKDEKEAKVAEAARVLQMEHLLDRRPTQLSGGQRQRVAIGRAIVRNPKVFLFDEPLSNLDASLRMDMRMEIGRLHQSLKNSMIYVTHDQVEAMTLADKIVVLKEGEVMQVGSPMELYHHPKNKFVAGFLGSPSMNFIPVDITHHKEEFVEVNAAGLKPIQVDARCLDKPNEHKALLGIRPQYLHAEDPEKAMLKGHVALSERLGSETVVDVIMPDQTHLIAAFAEDKVLHPGQPIGLSFDPAKAHVFSA